MASADVCRECGVALTDRPPERDPAARTRSSRFDAADYDARPLVEVYRSHRLDAEMIRSVLEANGIRAITSGEGYSSAYPMNVGDLGAHRVLVLPDDAARAHEVIDAAHRGEADLDLVETSVDLDDEDEDEGHEDHYDSEGGGVLTYLRTSWAVKLVVAIVLVAWIMTR
jgi:hypothetical protein